MKLTKKSGASMAVTAAALLISGVALIATANAETFKGRCFGVNGCKGQGNCKSAKNDCKGKNGCKGQGWLEMLQAECSTAGGQWEEI
jgi:uncharacterized membrane protein